MAKFLSLLAAAVSIIGTDAIKFLQQHKQALQPVTKKSVSLAHRRRFSKRSSSKKFAAELNAIFHSVKSNSFKKMKKAGKHALRLKKKKDDDDECAFPDNPESFKNMFCRGPKEDMGCGTCPEILQEAVMMDHPLSEMDAISVCKQACATFGECLFSDPPMMLQKSMKSTKKMMSKKASMTKKSQKSLLNKKAKKYPHYEYDMGYESPEEAWGVEESHYDDHYPEPHYDDMHYPEPQYEGMHYDYTEPHYPPPDDMYHHAEMGHPDMYPPPPPPHHGPPHHGPEPYHEEYQYGPEPHYHPEMRHPPHPHGPYENYHEPHYHPDMHHHQYEDHDEHDDGPHEKILDMCFEHHFEPLIVGLPMHHPDADYPEAYPGESDVFHGEHLKVAHDHHEPMMDHQPDMYSESMMHPEPDMDSEPMPPMHPDPAVDPNYAAPMPMADSEPMDMEPMPPMEPAPTEPMMPASYEDGPASAYADSPDMQPMEPDMPPTMEGSMPMVDVPPVSTEPPMMPMDDAPASIAPMTAAAPAPMVSLLKSKKAKAA